MRQLQKLQDFADATRSSNPGQCGPSRDVLIFHFLVPAELDTDCAKRPPWHGRILALGTMIEKAFEKTCKSLDTYSGETKQALADVKTEVGLLDHGPMETYSHF